jgi:hypothetical protein
VVERAVSDIAKEALHCLVHERFLVATTPAVQPHKVVHVLVKRGGIIRVLPVDGRFATGLAHLPAYLVTLLPVERRQIIFPRRGESDDGTYLLDSRHNLDLTRASSERRQELQSWGCRGHVVKVQHVPGVTVFVAQKTPQGAVYLLCSAIRDHQYVEVVGDVDSAHELKCRGTLRGRQGAQWSQANQLAIVADGQDAQLPLLAEPLPPDVLPLPGQKHCAATAAREQGFPILLQIRECAVAGMDLYTQFLAHVLSPL